MSKCLDELLGEYSATGWNVRTRGYYSVGHTHYVGAQIERVELGRPVELLVLVPAYRDDWVTWDSAGPTPRAKPLDGWRNASLIDGHGTAWYAGGWSESNNVLWLYPSYAGPARGIGKQRVLHGPSMRLRSGDGDAFTEWRGVRYVVRGREAPASFVRPTTCGTCGRTWDDGIVTGVTPAPSARCPFEHDHQD